MKDHGGEERPSSSAPQEGKEMRLTVKDLREIMGFLEVAKSTTERALRESPEGIYHDTMARQLERITALMERVDGLEV